MEASSDAHLVGWLKEKAEMARRNGSICTRAFMLAAHAPHPGSPNAPNRCFSVG